MAVSRAIDSTSLSIEVQSGTDTKGNATYTKKSFSGIRTDVTDQNAFDVAEAIKGVLSATTRAYYLNKNSKLTNA